MLSLCLDAEYGLNDPVSDVASAHCNRHWRHSMSEQSAWCTKELSNVEAAQGERIHEARAFTRKKIKNRCW
jgi:hypothetical protein